MQKYVLPFVLLSLYNMSHIMRKPDFCICKNKGADQLCSNCTADQPLCFRYTVSMSSPTYTQNFKVLAFLCDCTYQFMSDLIGNPEDRSSRDAAHIVTAASKGSQVSGNGTDLSGTSWAQVLNEWSKYQVNTCCGLHTRFQLLYKIKKMNKSYCTF